LTAQSRQQAAFLTRDFAEKSERILILTAMPRVLLLLPTTTYRTKAYIDAAIKLGVDVVAASERPSTLQNKNPEGLLTIDFSDPQLAAQIVEEYAQRFPIEAIIPVDEDTAVTASQAAHVLGLNHNSVESVRTAKNKYIMREVLNAKQVPVPRYWHFTLDDDIVQIAHTVTYPCVVKPVFLSTSRGVMRADNDVEFVSIVARLGRILAMKEVERRGGKAAREVLVEEFIPGREVALEGLLTDGKLRPLAIFDKPDPLDGPFFEETIYVTPSRFPESVQAEIIATTAAATRAMGLHRGAVHAELRINTAGAWVIEVAARAIGGLCSRALRFNGNVSLEELLIRHALGYDVESLQREPAASGVMMIPIPRAGTLKEVRGLESAKAIPNVDDIVISAHITQQILPPPEGASYLGFIFSRAESPEKVEAALREAHRKLEFVIE
jgi:biotin carboxylase